MRNRTEYEGELDVDDSLVKDLIAACRKVGVTGVEQQDALHPLKRVPLQTHCRSKRSRVMTLAHAFTKSRTNFSWPSPAA